jgi:DNA-binding NtrC family response regulator
MKSGQRILIIDEDTSFLDPVSALLRNAGYAVRAAQTGPAALEIVRREPIELALLDIGLGVESGLDVLPQLKALRPEMSVIIITALGTIENAVEAMRRGADNFIEKPIDPPRFLAILAKGLESRRLRRKQIQFERLTLPSQLMVWAEAPAMRDVLRLAEAVATRETTVLLRGETGTGKGLLARLIHEASPRKKEPFVELNCAGLQRDLTESELFGHERGAFTGAVERKIGLFEAADGGTLFLDEIGEMDMAVQAKLLNVLEQRKFRRVGGITEIEVDVRMMAATHRDLTRDVAAGRFREDLFYRLNVFTIDLPPLRDRPEDILPLAQHFLGEFYGPQPPPPRLCPAAEEILMSYHWPGNVRELRNVIERAAILCPPSSEILPAHLPSLGASSATTPPAQVAGGAAASSPAVPARDASSPPMTLQAVERQHLEATLKFNDWNLQATARDLGISRDTLYRKIEKYKLSSED